jgi:outer membrane protein insertion porin family
LAVDNPMLKKLCVLIALIGASATTLAEVFRVSDIRVEGLQRISAGSVFSAFPVNVGDRVDETQIAEATHELFKSGYFNDVEVLRENNDLILSVVELPSIAKLEIKGNKSIDTDTLKSGLKKAGLAEGDIFKRSTLDRLGLELERQYVSQGRYDANINTEVSSLPRNRVSLVIKIDEGNPASIRRINIVGNERFEKDVLLKQFQLSSGHFFSFYSKDDKYVREKLSGDLERLRSYYLDRGHIRFEIESTQVALSPAKDDVFITVNVHEGDIYSVNRVQLAGKFEVPQEVLERLILIKAGDTYSRQEITLTSELISKRLGNDGFTFAKVKGLPKINDDTKTVDITLFVDPGRRTYVRRINFLGNAGTIDEVLRREMRQMEGGWASTELIEHSKTKLERLPYIKSVNVKTTPVPGTDDQIDVDFSIEEQHSGSVQFSVGYSQQQGTILGLSLSQNNFLGTGKQVSAKASRNQISNSYEFGYLNPYYTVDGVSRGYNLYYTETNFDEIEAYSNYSVDRFGITNTFGLPIDSNQRLTFELDLSRTKVDARDRNIEEEIKSFVNEKGSGFTELTGSTAWRYSTLNRGVFPTEGNSVTLKAELSVPGSELEYYKITSQTQHYLSFNDDWGFRFKSELGYGDSYDDTAGLPFFRNFSSGGIGSVRGYARSSLGPKGVEIKNNEYIEGDTLGGNLLTEASVEFFFPLPFIEDQRSVRAAVFLDSGNAFTTQCYKLDKSIPVSSSNKPSCKEGFIPEEIRFSTGLSVTWITAIAPLTFTFGRALNADDDDDTEGFEFSLGQVY